MNRLHTVLLCLSAALLGAALRPSVQTVARLWPEGAPGAIGKTDADQPSLLIFPAPGASAGVGPGAGAAAMLVCPGGAYGMLALEKEGMEVAHWLNALGISAFVLRYRLGPVYRHPVEMEDGKRAMRWVRAHAAHYGFDPARVGMMGFSAGGHLTATVATHSDAGDPAARDSIERVSCRPDVQILIYPVITMDPSFTHPASRINLLGRNPNPAYVHFLSAEKHVDAKTPPAFLVHAKTDPIVPFANSVAYQQALLKAGVPVEFRAFDHGTHAFGLARLASTESSTGLSADPSAGPDAEAPLPNAEVSAWPEACARWLEKQGWPVKKANPTRPTPNPAMPR